MSMKQFDVRTAFLNGDLNETVFMEQPIGFTDGSQKVCKLKKSLYGLKQSSRCWNEKFTKSIKLFGFVQCKSDPCVFVSRQSGKLTILAIHVDDGIIVGENMGDVKATMKHLGETFEMKEMDIGCFLGLQIQMKISPFLSINQATRGKYWRNSICKNAARCQCQVTRIKSCTVLMSPMHRITRTANLLGA